MCGLTGFIDFSLQSNSDTLRNAVGAMANELVHRGPDDGGIWVDEKCGIALGHRRLAIIDTSTQGHQPMVSRSGRFVIVLNGEVYNFEILRKELEKLGHVFKGHSDTEVILNAVEEWGIHDALKIFIGMFAFALWDRNDRLLYLVRDRIGKKPLYYGWMGKVFLFGSELKALRLYPGFDARVNRNSLALYLRYNNVPAPYSIFQDINKLEQGTVLTLRCNDEKKGISIASYWSAKDAVEKAVKDPFRGSEKEAIESLNTIMHDAVGLRMISDVPLGAFLSGGIDSSTVVSLMQAQSRTPVRTFSIGYYESRYNEAKYAKSVASHLGTEHTELYVTPQEAMAVIPQLPILYDEPFADSSQIPTFLISKLTRQFVTVALSGDGGDELFAGYNRYFWIRKIWKNTLWMPPVLRNAFSNILDSISSQGDKGFFSKIPGVLPDNLRYGSCSHKIRKLAEILRLKSLDEIYLRLVSHCKDPLSIVPGAQELPLALTTPEQWPRLEDFTQKIMYLDLISYLPNDILVKVDRASMGVSLEVRNPLLDHRVVEFAWRIPLSMKIKKGQSKWLLRQVAYQYIPKEILKRPKMGFAIPLDSWLRGPLKEWAGSLIYDSRAGKEGFLNPKLLQQKWEEHLSGKFNWQDFLWPVLMFQEWKNRWL